MIFESQFENLLKQEEVLNDLRSHIYVHSSCTFHVDPNQVEKVIRQILTHNNYDDNPDDAFLWEELIEIVNSWNRRIGFSWHKPNEMNDPSKFCIFPVFFEEIRVGSRQDFVLENGLATKISSRQNIKSTVDLVS